MNSKAIRDFHTGDEVTGFFVLQAVELQSRSEGRGNMLALVLSDATGQIAARLLENVEKAARELEPGDIIKIKGMVHGSPGNKHIVIQLVRRAADTDDIDMHLLVPATQADFDALWREYTRLAGNVVNPFFKSLLRKFTENEEFRAACYETPGGAGSPHNYLGGMLEHTVHVTQMCEKLAAQYAQINRDLLITACLLHDIGKIRAFQHGPTFEMTVDGRLLGVMLLGNQMIGDKVREIPAFPDDLSKKLQAVLVAAWNTGSADAAVAAEALLLRQAKRIDEELNAIKMQPGKA